MLPHHECYVKGKSFFKGPDFETLCKQTPMSRSSKTPHGFYLANRGINAAPRRRSILPGVAMQGFGAIKQHLPRLPPVSEQDRNPRERGYQEAARCGQALQTRPLSRWRRSPERASTGCFEE